MKRNTVGVIICIGIVLAVFIPVIVFYGKGSSLQKENDALLKEFERSLRGLEEYRDKDGYIDRISVKTDFKLGYRKDDWVVQECIVEIKPHLRSSFMDLSEFEKCKVICENVRAMKDEFERIRDKSDYMAFRNEKAGGRNGYVRIGQDHIGYYDLRVKSPR